jgi:hypothetical protein
MQPRDVRSHHPSDVGDLATGDDDQERGQSEDKGEQDERHGRCWLRGDDRNYDQIAGKTYGSWKSERADKVDKDDESGGYVAV